MLNRSASLAMSTSVLKALPGKLDIKRHSPSILYLLGPTVLCFMFQLFLTIVILLQTCRGFLLENCWVSVCECDDSLLYCVSRNLSRIPNLIPDRSFYQGISLNFDNNLISSLDGRPFEKLGQFIYGDTLLSLQSNQIHDIHPDVFVGVEGKLNTIILSNNSLSYLPVAFSSLTRLTQLDLSENPLRSLDGNVISTIGKTLQYTSLSMEHFAIFPSELANMRNLSSLKLEGVAVSDFDKNAFTGSAHSLGQLEINYSYLDGIPLAVCKLTSVRTLIFNSNNMTTLGNISTVCPVLPVEYLDLYNNSITNIYDDDLSGFPNLIRLWLNRNPVRYISPGAFKNNVNLTDLTMDGTELHYLPVAITALPHLNSVSLSGAFNCSCASMSGLRSWGQRVAQHWPLYGGFCDVTYISLQEYFTNELPKCP